MLVWGVLLSLFLSAGEVVVLAIVDGGFTGGGGCACVGVGVGCVCVGVVVVMLTFVC